jgi:predicted transcriptional regulator of viral defense system
MNRLADMVLSAGLGDRLFSDRQLADIIGDGDARRYGLVNRALKDGSLVRVVRGVSVLSAEIKKNAIHPFAVAQALLPGSYVSFETALSWHGWIPEGVFTTASVTPGRKTLTRDHAQFGRFTFHPLALEDFQFLASVSRVRVGQHVVLIADPLRALMDLVAFRKEHWTGLGWIEEGLRIDAAQMGKMRRKDFAALRSVYKHKAARAFLAGMEEALLDTPKVLRALTKRRAGGKR